MSSSPTDYRYATWLVLKNFEPDKHDTAELIEKYGSKTQNRAAVVEIAFGVIRNLTFIDALIRQISTQSVNKISEKILNCLRIAVYELIFSGQPDYAVVSEVVNLANKIGSKKSAGFVNAVLRKICASIKNRTADLKNADPRKILPLTPKLGCEFDIDILPDPARQPAEYFSNAFSLPPWLIEQWIIQFGNKKTADICFASNRRPGIYARANKLKLTSKELFEILKDQDIDCDYIEKYKPVVSLSNPMVRLKKIGNISELKAFKEGLFTIQDITSSSVVPLLNPQSGWKIFDICAAPGTKTTQIAELISDKGLVIATDKNNLRLKKIDENIRRLGITSIRIMDYETFLKDSSCQSCADAVLLDAPCSNSGVLARRPEVRFRITPKKICELAQIQTQLLNLAASLVKPGGRICYSTCSILSQENNEVVTNFLTKHHKFSLENENLILPSACAERSRGVEAAEICDFDGGYAAIIVKK
ncbi:MAG: transcription antitermination factor NusB [Sedimentisphaerales bacterium]